LVFLTGIRHYLLAASGVSTASALRDLNNFSQSAAALTAPPAGAADTDIEAFVSNLHAQSTLDLIQEGLEQSKRDFDSFLEENVQMNWDAQRRRIYEHFGLAKPSENLAESVDDTFAETAGGAFGRSSRRSRALGASLSASGGMSFGPQGLTKSVLGNSSFHGTLRGSALGDTSDKTPAGALQAGAELRFERDKAEKYAVQVKELNSARNQENAYPVIHKFLEVEEQAGIDVGRSISRTSGLRLTTHRALPPLSIRTKPSSASQRRSLLRYVKDRPALSANASTRTTISMRTQIRTRP
jgi:nuclear pore complex protein Nup93